MRSAPSLQTLQVPLWLGMVALDKGPIYGSNSTAWHLNCVHELNKIVRTWTVCDLTVCKQMTDV